MVSDVSDEDRAVMRECISEAMMYRSVPAAMFTGLHVRYFIRKHNFWLNGWPVVLGASCLAWFAGKLSYIHGKHCQDKFLEKAPNSKITAQILAVREEERIHSEEHGKKKMLDLKQEDVVLGSLTDKEKTILNDCNSTAFWFYSVPLMICFSSLIFIAQKKSLLAPSKIFKKFPFAPKMSVAIASGYVTGQWLYMKSGDCSERFEKFAPNSQMAKIWRNGGFTIGNDQFQVQYIPEEDEVSEAEKPKEAEGAAMSNTYEGYIMPSSSDGKELEKSIFDKPNSFDVLMNK